MYVFFLLIHKCYFSLRREECAQLARSELFARWPFRFLCLARILFIFLFPPSLPLPPPSPFPNPPPVKRARAVITQRSSYRKKFFFFFFFFWWCVRSGRALYYAAGFRFISGSEKKGALRVPKRRPSWLAHFVFPLGEWRERKRGNAEYCYYYPLLLLLQIFIVITTCDRLSLLSVMLLLGSPLRMIVLLWLLLSELETMILGIMTIAIPFPQNCYIDLKKRK